MSSRQIVHRMLLFGILLRAAAGSASVSFRSPVNYTVGTNPGAVAIGDFNGDGHADVAVVNAGDSTKNDPGGISILLGNGDGTFKPAINFSAVNYPGFVAVGDFDGDGNDDLAVLRLGVVGGSDKGGVTIFLSNADGTFRKGQQISTFNNPAGVVTTDLNSDGVDDLAVWDGTSISILSGNGDGTFQTATTYFPMTDKYGGKSPSRLIVLDFNQDGKKDLGFSVGLPSNTPHTLEVLVGNGDGTFQPASIVNTFSLTEDPRFEADFNHDGNVDVLIYACGSNGCGEYLLLSNGDGTFSNPPGTNVLTPSVESVGDFDGDENPDLAGPANSGQVALAVFTGNGDGSFQHPVTFSANAGSSVEVALVADLNNDKAPDLVTISGLAGTNTISVMLNAGTDFSISASAFSPGSIGAGQSASSTLSLQLLNLFNNPVALACSVQPAQAGAPTCSLNSDSVTFDASGKASATLTVSTGSRAMLNRGLFGSGVSFWFPIAGAVLFGTGFSARARKRRTFLGIIAFAVLLALISLQACGGGEAGPKSTQYVVTITGTSGQTTHSSTVNVTVQ